MKGTIDPVDAIFTAFSGLGGRIFCFFGTCCLGFGLGLLTASVTWTQNWELHGTEALADWYFAPVSWMFATVAGCFRWWGVLHLLALIVVAYHLIYEEASVCQTFCLLFLMESWLWCCVGAFLGGEYSFDDWHPLLPVLMLLSIGVAWLGWRSWKMDHPSEDEEEMTEEVLDANLTTQKEGMSSAE